MNISSFGIGAYGGAGLYSSTSFQRAEQGAVAQGAQSQALSGQGARQAPTQDWSRVTLAVQGEAQLMLPSVPEMDGVRLEGVELEDSTQKLNYRAHNILSQAGVQMPPNPVLTVEPDGRVVVVNGHPDKSRIEAVLNERPELRNHFVQVSQAYLAQRAIDGYAAYQQQKERLQGDAQAEAALVQAEIARNTAPFYLAVSAQGAEPFFGTPRGTVA